MRACTSEISKSAVLLCMTMLFWRPRWYAICHEDAVQSLEPKVKGLTAVASEASDGLRSACHPAHLVKDTFW